MEIILQFPMDECEIEKKTYLHPSDVSAIHEFTYPFDISCNGKHKKVMLHNLGSQHLEQWGVFWSFTCHNVPLCDSTAVGSCNVFFACRVPNSYQGFDIGRKGWQTLVKDCLMTLLKYESRSVDDSETSEKKLIIA